MAALEKTQSNRAIQSLQGLRFLAILIIFFTHITYSNIQLAACSVSFFVILSGFLYGYKDFPADTAVVSGTVSLLRKKVLKFYPLHLVMLVATLPLEPLSKTPSAVLNNVLLLQCYSDKYYFAFNGVSWFLSLIVFLTIWTIPLKKFLSRIGEKNRYFLFALFLILIAVNFLLCYQVNQMGVNIQYWLYVCPIVRVLEYTCGMITGYLISRTGFSISKTSATVLEAVILLLFFALMMIPDLPEYLHRNVIWVIPLCILLAVFSLEKGVISRLFRAKPLVHLGSITFEFFMIHLVIIKYIDKYQLLSQVPFVFKFILVLAICVILSELASLLLKKIKK